MEKLVSACAVVVGIALCLLAGLYWTRVAGSLPAYIPGFEAGSAKIHFKHGLGSLLLGLAMFAFAWFYSGQKRA